MPTKPRRRRLISLRGVGELAQHQTPRHNDVIRGVGLRQEERVPGFTVIRRLAIRFQGMLRRHKENKLEEWCRCTVNSFSRFSMIQSVT
jgi:hypothetical protein